MRTSLVGLCALLICAFGSEPADAKQPLPPTDHSSCVCDLLPARQFDVVIATPQEVGGELQYVVDAIITHGTEVRQVIGQPVVGVGYYVGDTNAVGPVLIFDKMDPQFHIFEVIELPAGDWQNAMLWQFSAMNAGHNPDCRTGFNILTLQRFLIAYRDSNTECATLATKHLGFPNPDELGEGCAGGRSGSASPGWLASVLAALGLLGWRAQRREVSLSRRRGFGRLLRGHTGRTRSDRPVRSVSVEDCV